MSEQLDLREPLLATSDDPVVTSLIEAGLSPSHPQAASAVLEGARNARLRHRKHGRPSAIWSYRNTDGSILAYVARYEPRGETKQIIPWTPTSETADQWQPKAPPAPRPLFNLDQLAARPDAPVLIVEGEKAAVGLDGRGGAAALLPGYVVTTSMSGAKAAGKTDWSPLVGYHVIIWPDADEPGALYAQAVAILALEAGAASVRVVDVADLPDGFDLGDPLPEGLDVEARLDAARLMEPPPPEAGEERSSISFGPFRMRCEGLHILRDGQEPEWISAPFEVLGRGRDPHGNGWGRLLHWRDEDDRPHQHFVPDATLHGEPAALAAELARGGLTISTKPIARRDLAAYLNQVRVDQRVTLTSHTGWHMIHGCPVFVLPAEAIGSAGGEKVILQHAEGSPYESRGTLEEWRESIGALVADHRRLVLMCSVAFAGPLLDLIGVEGGGIHLYGNSSTGKTTSIAPAASVWGKGASPGFILPWRQTANAFEVTAARHTDSLLVFDEVGVADARAIATSVYQITAGAGKGRLNRDATLRARSVWRVMLISTGEVPVAAKIAEESGRSPHAGQLVRMLDIPADAGRGYGVFDHPGPASDPGALSDAIKRAAAENYGTAGPAFVSRLLEEGVEGVVEVVLAMIDSFVAAQTPPNADGQVQRAAKRFGLIGAAGELAREWGLVPWREGAALEAAADAYRDWIAARGGVTSAESEAQIAQVRRFIEQFGESRFDPMPAEPDTRPAPNRAGWRRDNGEAREWLILPEAWKNEVCKGLDSKATARLLSDRGMLRRSDTGGTLQRCERTPHGIKRVYVLSLRILQEASDAG